MPIPGLDQSIPFRSCLARPAGLAQRLCQNLMVSKSGPLTSSAPSSRPWSSGLWQVSITPSCLFRVQSAQVVRKVAAQEGFSQPLFTENGLQSAQSQSR